MALLRLCRPLGTISGCYLQRLDLFSYLDKGAVSGGSAALTAHKGPYFE
ncbi:hypothetical protein [Eubacterium callanderi]|uniref:Uncharacterized protein n=1 Tax=Eubacterium callanderi TaxID=53442 RepID=E3GQF2_9FIRM|nr:hypothetical protein [Eubacterium callanderi]ADO39244.1 hypothetical protein ELI_4304 [Eubacterium callanderi]